MKQVNWKLAVGGFLLAMLIVTARALPGLSSAVPTVFSDTGIGYDPLTTDEADQALALAVTKVDKILLTGERQAVTTQPLEVLAVERYDAPKGSSATTRQGDVYLYDYGSDTLIHSIVDVASGAVTVEKLQGMQLPLTPREEDRAVQLLQDDRDLWAKLAARYQTITDEALTSTAQLQVKVSLFLADAMPDQVNVAAQQCGKHRCAQVLLFTTDRTVLEVLPIVDLSRGQVVQLLSDSWIDSPDGGATFQSSAEVDAS
ncbi:MAG: hypothetical protein R2932_07925 [Caldilineaceae bacterium]